MIMMMMLMFRQLLVILVYYWFDYSLGSDCEIHYSEEATFYSTAIRNVRTALCVLPSENKLLTVMHLTI